MEFAENPGSSGFGDLGLADDVVRAIEALGYEEPSPIQQRAIPVMLTGRDLLGRAATGTGKTAAFALPIVSRLDPGPARRGDSPRALVLVPTRELAMQVAEAIGRYGKHREVGCVAVYGGQPIGRQIDALRRGCHVVVATPGRTLDLLRKEALALESVRTVVLDEADEMLDMGFAEDLEAILDALPDERQTVLFSATMPPRIDKIARRHLDNPERITVENVHRDDTALVRQLVYVVQRAHKITALGRILEVESPEAAIVFCKTREAVDELSEKLNRSGRRAEALHGGMDQQHRDRVMNRMRNRTVQLLIATDVAARGLDISHLSHVVNFDLPSAPEAYVHRIGRVGRAGRTGTAISLADPRERRLLQSIERTTRAPIESRPVPSPADVRTHRLRALAEQVANAIGTGATGDVDEAVEILRRDHDDDVILRTALAMLLSEQAGGTDDAEIPDLSVERPNPRAGATGRGDGEGRGPKGGRRPGERPVEVATLHVSIGRKAGVRPADLVGAVANQSGVPGRDIGVRIFDTHSTVEVPADLADHVLDSMQRTVIRGKKALVRRYRYRR